MGALYPWPLKELNWYSISNIIIVSIERTPEAKGSRQ
jgi:hypothetical protein